MTFKKNNYFPDELCLLRTQTQTIFKSTFETPCKIIYHALFWKIEPFEDSHFMSNVLTRCSATANQQNSIRFLRTERLLCWLYVKPCNKLVTWVQEQKVVQNGRMDYMSTNISKLSPCLFVPFFFRKNVCKFQTSFLFLYDTYIKLIPF